jgi:hypothetical protein
LRSSRRGAVECCRTVLIQASLRTEPRPNGEVPTASRDTWRRDRPRSDAHWDSTTTIRKVSTSPSSKHRTSTHRAAPPAVPAPTADAGGLTSPAPRSPEPHADREARHRPPRLHRPRETAASDPGLTGEVESNISRLLRPAAQAGFSQRESREVVEWNSSNLLTVTPPTSSAKRHPRQQRRAGYDPRRTSGLHISEESANA